MILKKNQSKISQIIKRLDADKSPFIKKPLLDCSDGIKIQVADTQELREKSYQLMYETYLDKDYINENPSKLHFTEHDLLQETVVLLAMKDSEVVGTMSIIPDSPFGLPAEKSYFNELEDLKKNGEICEISALGIKKEERFNSNILIKLLNAATLYSTDILKKSHWVITVNPSHVAFYIKKLLFKVIGEEKKIDKVLGAPAILLLLSLDEVESVINNQKKSTNGRLLKHFVSINAGQNFIQKFKLQTQKLINI